MFKRPFCTISQELVNLPILPSVHVAEEVPLGVGRIGPRSRADNISFRTSRCNGESFKGGERG